MSHGRGAERGVVSMLFLLALTPVLLVMLAVTLELAHLIGVREDLRSALDEEGYNALAYQRSSTEMEASLRQRLLDARQLSFSMVELRGVTSSIDRSSASVSASLDYKGTLLSFVENVLGRKSQVLTLSATTRVRRQRGGVLLVLDRSVGTANDGCAAAEFDARATFIDGIASALTTNSDTFVRVAVFPGAVEAIDMLSPDGGDEIARCRARRDDSRYDTRALMAQIGAPGDPLDVTSKLSDHVSVELLSMPLEYRAVVLVLGLNSYSSGYSAYAQQALNALAEAAQLPLQVLIVTAEVDSSFTPLPPVYGSYGGIVREVGASRSELLQGRLGSAFSRSVMERIVWER